MKVENRVAFTLGVPAIAAMFLAVYILEGRRGTFNLALIERKAEIGQEAVEWAHEQVFRRVGPGWAVSLSAGTIWWDDDDRQLEDMLDTLCTWARAQASSDSCDRILEQDTPYPAIKEVQGLLGVLKMTVRFPGDFNDRLAQRQFFDEIDAEIQELIRI